MYISDTYMSLICPPLGMQEFRLPGDCLTPPETAATTQAHPEPAAAVAGWQQVAGQGQALHGPARSSNPAPGGQTPLTISARASPSSKGSSPQHRGSLRIAPPGSCEQVDKLHGGACEDVDVESDLGDDALLPSMPNPAVITVRHSGGGGIASPSPHSLRSRAAQPAPPGSSAAPGSPTGSRLRTMGSSPNALRFPTLRKGMVSSPGSLELAAKPPGPAPAAQLHAPTHAVAAVSEITPAPSSQPGQKPQLAAAAHAMPPRVSMPMHPARALQPRPSLPVIVGAPVGASIGTPPPEQPRWPRLRPSSPSSPSLQTGGLKGLVSPLVYLGSCSYSTC